MRTKFLKVINYATYLSACALTGVGFLLAYKLPSHGESHGKLVLDLARHDWAEIHLYCAFVFIVSSLLHLALNWSWVVKVAAARKKSLLFLSVGIGLLLIAAPLLAPVETSLRGGSQSDTR